MVVGIKFDSSVFKKKSGQLIKTYRGNKFDRLWRPIAREMAVIYEEQYTNQWSGFDFDNTPAYEEWKNRNRLNSGPLNMTGKLKKLLTRADGPIEPGSGTNQHQLVLSVNTITTNLTGSGVPPDHEVIIGDFVIEVPVVEHPLGDYPYASVLASHDTNVPTPYGVSGEKGLIGNVIWEEKTIEQRDFLWDEAWLPRIVRVGEKFTRRAAREAFGPKAVK